MEKPKKIKRSDNVIPDYDFLFADGNSVKVQKKPKVFRKIVKINWPMMLLSAILYLFQSAPLYITPLITANIINTVTSAVNTTGVTAEVWRIIIIDVVILVVVLLQNIPSTYFRHLVTSKMLRRINAGIKSSVIRKLQSLSITYHKDIQTGKIQAKFLKDIESIDLLFRDLMFNIIPNVLGVIIATVIAVLSNGWVALFFLGVIPVNVALTRVFRSNIRRRAKNFREKNESVSIKLSTMFNMMMVTKSHGLEETEKNTIEGSITELTGAGIKLDKTNALFGATAWVINHLLSGACLVFCAILALNKIIGVGDIVLFQSMFGQISAYVSGMVGIIPQLATGADALSSVAEIMSATDVEVSIGKKIPPKIVGQVEFKDVYYKYPNTEQFVVQGLNLKVMPGECIAVVGSSGSGKSTLMNLIIGLLVPTSGSIEIDGQPLTEFNLSKYRNNISVVPQNSILFADTIRQNITYGLNSYTEEELQTAIDKANLNEMLNDLPNGLETDIGEHGDKLSGGQKQRITIARALIRNPKILILDEATSALDNISEYHVQQAIAKSIRGRTTFIVAHRLSTIRDADRIVVLEGGVAVEIGTYDELMAKKGKFYELKSLNDINLKKAEQMLG